MPVRQLNCELRSTQKPTVSFQAQYIQQPGSSADKCRQHQHTSLRMDGATIEEIPNGQLAVPQPCCEQAGRDKSRYREEEPEPRGGEAVTCL